tara:strand:+ start:65 stop:532 length:468 start_codon:yes stop_codon:yes gene_type:complete
MRVNIQYSVELEDVPEELETLVESTVSEKLREAVAQTEALDFDDRTDHVLSYIDGIRKLLYAVDERLSDVDAILRGWSAQQAAVVASEAPQTPQEEPAVAETEFAGVGAASAETMEFVRASLAAHKVETDALRRTLNLGFDPDAEDGIGELGDEG